MKPAGPLCFLLCVTLTAATACSSAEEPLSGLQIGGSDHTGETFVDWSGPGVEAAMNPGPQGCCHVWISLRSPELASGSAKVSLEMRLDDIDQRVEPGLLKVNTTLKANPAPPHRYGLPGFIDCPCTVRDRTVRAIATVTDSQGKTLSAQATFIPRLGIECTGAADDAPFCIYCPKYDQAPKLADRCLAQRAPASP